MSADPENERSAPLPEDAPTLNQLHPQDATNSAECKPIDGTPPRKQTIAELLASKLNKATPAPVAQVSTTSIPGTNDAEISVYERVERTTPFTTITIRDFVKDIHDGTHAAAVAKVRDIVEQAAAGGWGVDQKKTALQTAKRRFLHAVGISGVVTSGVRAKAFEDGRFRHSGWLQIDLDGKDLNGRKTVEVRDLIGKDPHILSACLSPTGEGVKGIMRIPICETAADVLAVFYAAESYMLATYGLKIDQATKDATRLCYVTHDPQATWNATPIPLEVPAPAPEIPQATRIPTPPRQGTGIPAAQDAPLPPATPGMATRQGLILRETGSPREITAEDARAMLDAIPRRPEYSQWLRIASAVWDAVGEDAGTALLMEWSPEETTGEYAEKFQHRLTDVSLGTLVMLAKAHGWTPDPRQQVISKPTKKLPATARPYRPMFSAPCSTNAPSMPPRCHHGRFLVLMLGDKVISTPGNLTNIQAPAKAGKSAVIGAIIAAVFNGNRLGADTLGFSADNSPGAPCSTSTPSNAASIMMG